MVFLSLALFFFPLVNGLIAGLVGGYKVGSPGRALLAAILPAALVAGGLWVVFALFDAPIRGVLAGAARPVRRWCQVPPAPGPMKTAAGDPSTSSIEATRQLLAVELSRWKAMSPYPSCRSSATSRVSPGANARSLR